MKMKRRDKGNVGPMGAVEIVHEQESIEARIGRHAPDPARDTYQHTLALPAPQSLTRGPHGGPEKKLGANASMPQEKQNAKTPRRKEERAQARVLAHRSPFSATGSAPSRKQQRRRRSLCAPRLCAFALGFSAPIDFFSRPELPRSAAISRVRKTGLSNELNRPRHGRLAYDGRPCSIRETMTKRT